MLDIVFLVITFAHGCIHIMGFGEGFKLFDAKQINQDISKEMGVLWLLSFIMITIYVVLFMFDFRYWWLIGLLSSFLSEFLIISCWSDAKYGTIPNILIVLISICGFFVFKFKKEYENDVISSFSSIKQIHDSIVLEEKVKQLPLPVQRYFKYLDLVGKNQIRVAKICFDGKIRGKGKEYMSFSSEQHNFPPLSSRFFYMKAKMIGITLPGYHCYKEGKAKMEISLIGLIPVAKFDGSEMNQAETVTLFNDMCIMYPSSLIDERIEWESIDDNTCKAKFTNCGITISATLYFNEIGELVDFYSTDRIEINENLHIPFSTPIKDYKNISGNKVSTYGEAIWHYNDGKFTYGVFNLQDIKYNVIEA